jgi:hypothetical protein
MGMICLKYTMESEGCTLACKGCWYNSTTIITLSAWQTPFF